ncbi:MAG: hypothetical protein U5K54_20500 [Cytophagales bacterium]|nr:hypothetical protein [Cytophagales bacterium]
MPTRGTHLKPLLTIKAFDEIFQELLLKDREGRMQIPGMIELRVDMIVVACCLINHLTFQNIDLMK